MRMVLRARRRCEVTRVHSDREGAILNIEKDLLGIGCLVSTTQGSDPQSNGIAEAIGGKLARMARAMVGHYKGNVAAALWPRAMEWAAQRAMETDLPPFGCKVLSR